MKKDISFLGQGWAFPPGFALTHKSVDMVDQDEDIQQSLVILLSTQLGERLMQPLYGCDLHNTVFEKLDRTVITYLKDTIETSIIYHEPRIKLIEIEVNQAVDQEGKIIFNITYIIRSTNSRSNLVYPHYITEATDRFF